MIIVTGAAGFIGSNLIGYLNTQDEDDIIAVDNLVPEKVGNLLGLKFKKFYNIETFLTEFDQWHKVSVIFHEGAISSTTETDQKKIDYYNINFSMELLRKAVENNILFSYASSASVYGNSLQFNEDAVLQPMSLYAQSKALLDHEVTRLLATNPNYKIQGWRYFNVYGPCENHKGDQASPITKFTNQALDDNTIKIFKDSDKFKRDFICVDDIIRIKYETSKKSVSGIYNLGTGEPVSFKQVAQFISKKFNATMEEIDFPENLKGQYQEYTCADLNKLRTVIGSYRFISVDAFVNSL